MFDDTPEADPMATVPAHLDRLRNGYPTSDGKPMAETDWHRKLMTILIEILETFFAGQRVYVSGNLLVFYEPGNRRRHVSPDVFVVRGVENYQRPNYLVWEERRGPEVVIELTSSTTRREDRGKKLALYRDTLRVKEYYLFDPRGDYLKPSLQGYRLRGGVYHPIHAVNGRLPSRILGLHLERDGQDLRLWNPETQAWLPKPEERIETAEQRAETAEQRAAAAELARQQAEERAAALTAELQRLRRPPS
jgi:Uma2 family endonuclease